MSFRKCLIVIKFYGLVDPQNYNVKQEFKSGSLAQKHDTEICLDNPIKTKVNSSIKRKQLNM